MVKSFPHSFYEPLFNSHVNDICITSRLQDADFPDLVMKGTQQLSKPVEGLNLPADPHKIHPLQPEPCPTITGWTAKSSEGEKKEETSNTFSKQSALSWMWHFHNSQQSMQHTGKRCDPDSTGNTQTDIVVKHVLWWTSKRTVHIKPGHMDRRHIQP